jgi:hypothetical protein
MYTLPVDYTTLTPQQRREVREQYIKEQNNLCFYCNLPLDKEVPHNLRTKWINPKLFPENFFKYPIHLQHDHNTNMTEGAVHNYCNAVMWQYEGR